MPDIFSTIMYAVAIILVVLTLSSMIVITRQKTVKHISLLGRYQKTVTPGLSFKIPFITSVDYEITTAICENTVELRLKTKDQVTFTLNLQVIYKVSDDIKSSYRAAYDLEDFEDQITSITVDSAIPIANGISLEDVFDKKENITDGAKAALTEFLEQYGIEVLRVLSDEPGLPKAVEESANEVISSKRLNDAARYKAEAIKTEKVGEATADGESVRIRMEETGKARKRYAETTAEAVTILVKSGVTPESAVNFLSRVGDQDSLVSASRNSRSTILSIPSGDNAKVAGLTTALNEGHED